MASIFKRLIRKEFGVQKYRKYFVSMQNGVMNKQMDGTEVYVDIVRTLRGRDMGTMARMHDRLNEAMIYALKVNRSIGMVAVLYAVSMAAVIFAVSQVYLCVAAAVLLTGVFIYKIYEYLINRYCFIDAQIILVYKRALEKLLLSNIGGENDNTV